MKIIDCEQRSPEWYKAKCGIPSASNFSMIVDTSGKPSKQAMKYVYTLAGETLLGYKEETYQSKAMEDGIIREEEARETYEFITGNKVEQVGFCTNDEGTYGASPDGLVGKDGSTEIKCPMLHTHIGYLLKGILPLDYFQQVQGQLLVTGRKWCDFMSYYPGLKPFIIRVKPDKKFLSMLTGELTLFNEALKIMVEKIR